MGLTVCDVAARTARREHLEVDGFDGVGGARPLAGEHVVPMMKVTVQNEEE